MRNFQVAGRFLALDLETDLPLNEYAGREDFLTALSGFGAVVSQVELLAEFENGDEALLLYDLEVDGVGPLRIAEHFTVADGQITRIRMVNDTAELRKAGFAG
jgi:hypothetical protein